MFVQFRFKSFYKIRYLINHKQLNETNVSKKKTIGVGNLLFFIFLFFFKNQKYVSEHLKYTINPLPIKKKNIIFLRAPYKNKLARLNILRLEYTTIITVKQHKKIFFILNKTTKLEFNNLIKMFMNYNISTHKLKHTKSKIVVNVKYNNNFIFCNFN